MQPASKVSPDGKYWWDGQTWQKLPTLADALELDVAHAADPAHYGQVAGAVVLWALLLLGLGIVALGAISLVDLLIPGHRQAGGVALVVVDIAVGGLVGLPAVLQSGWFTRPANSASVNRSWMPWVLWAFIWLGIGIVALGMFALLALVIRHHPKPSSAAPDLLVIGLGGLICLGPTLRLRGFGLLTSRRTQAPRPAKLARPLTGSERAGTGIGISGMVLVVVGVFVVTASKAGVGWAIVAALASGIAFGIPVSIALARQRRNRSLALATAHPPPPPTLSGSMTLRPTRFNRSVAPIILLAIAGVFLVGGYEMLVHQGPGETWLDSAGGMVAFAFGVVCCIAVAVLAPKAYIRVDDSTITFGPALTAFAARRSSFNRREVALIRTTHSPMTRITLFLRSDGSTLTSTSGYFWGRDGLQRLADYLGVPLEW
jgi:hypothetical protein